MKDRYEVDESLENKIFKIILLFGVGISVINFFVNFSVGFNWLLNYKWIVLGILSLLILRSAQKEATNIFQLKLGYFLFLIFLFIPFSWLQSGGSDNNTLSYMFLLLIAITFLFKNSRSRNGLVLSLIGVFIILFSLEYFYPEILLVHSPQSQFIDKLIQTPFVLTASYLLLLQFARAYNQEKSKLGLSTKKLRLANEKLQKLANRDSLTQKYNRRAFDEEIRNIFRNNQHQKTDITLILFDIDNFKKINDNYGHDIGDQVLIKLADELEATMPQNTLISRWGGDEFAIICYKSEIETQKYLDDYYRNVENLSKKMNIHFTVSAGLSRIKKDDQLKKLFKRVDDILYKSKEEGKARYTVA